MTTHEERLRAWAKGSDSYPIQAATELLLRAYDGKFAQSGNLWVMGNQQTGTFIQFGAIPLLLKGIPRKEANFLLFAASLSNLEVGVDLGEIVGGLDREVLPLVFAALAHANASHERFRFVKYTDDRQPDHVPLPSVYPWPAPATKDTAGSTPATPLEEQLRAWAKGSYPLEAATELLLRAFDGKFARPGNPWIINPDSPALYIDFDRMPKYLDDLFGVEQQFDDLLDDERRVLLFASTLSYLGGPVDLGDVLTGLDRELLNLVLAAVAHAGGGHSQSGFVVNADGTQSLQRLPPLHPWPHATDTEGQEPQ